MKKFTSILLIGTLIVAGSYYYTHITNQPIITKTQQNQLRDLEESNKRLEYLKKLSNPEYVQGALRKTGKLTTLEGSYKYSTNIKENGLYGYVTLREMTLDLDYDFGICMDLQYIKVRTVLDKIIVIQIPKKQLQLQYIQLNIQNSKVFDGKKFMFADQFPPSEVEAVIEQSQQNVVNRIGADDKLFDSAMENLKDELEKLIISLGYKEVMFEEI